MQRREIRDKNRFIVFDADIIPQLDPLFFTPDEKEVQNQYSGVGRAEVCFFTHADIECVLRHYRRGGLPAKIIKDHYFGLNPVNSRAFREWTLLAQLYEEGFPVPQPIAAQVIKKGFCRYQADLITRRIDAQPLAQWMKERRVIPELMQRVGKTIKQFHQRGVYHADLNARNIMVDKDETVYLIDFDRGSIRHPGKWQQQNLKRLKRSFEKFKAKESGFGFDEKAWGELMEGYGALS